MALKWSPSLTPQRTFEDFRRFLVTRAGEQCVVDLVVDRAPVIDAEKVLHGTIRVDTLREIAANKLCTLVGRSELKDLADVREFVRSGVDLRQTLEDAQRKDASADPATLAWVLSHLKITPAARVPEGIELEELEAFRLHLIKRFEALAFERARRSP